MGKLRSKISYTVAMEQFNYILETFPSLVTISAKHQILRSIGRKNKLWGVKNCQFLDDVVYGLCSKLETDRQTTTKSQAYEAARYSMQFGIKSLGIYSRSITKLLAIDQLYTATVE